LLLTNRYACDNEAPVSGQEKRLPPTGIHLWRLSTVGDGNLRLCCNQDRLFLGRTPLIEPLAGGYAVRAEADLEGLFKCSSVGADLGRLWRGLGVVKSALDENNLPLAQIAAVQLRIPDRSGFRARAALEAEDRLIKAECGGDLLARADWDPDKHPRAGTPPNPGWFAPTDGPGALSPVQKVAQGEEEEGAPEEMLDPMGPPRQAQWDAQIAILRRLEPNNPNLVYMAPPGPPSAEAVARLDAG
jgi:hypothetical protein